MFGSLQSMTMVLGPLLAGVLLESTINMHWWAAGFYVLAACILFPYLLQEKKNID
jgi:MFS family permease